MRVVEKNLAKLGNRMRKHFALYLCHVWKHSPLSLVFHCKRDTPTVSALPLPAGLVRRGAMLWETGLCSVFGIFGGDWNGEG